MPQSSESWLTLPEYFLLGNNLFKLIYATEHYRLTLHKWMAPRRCRYLAKVLRYAKIRSEKCSVKGPDKFWGTRSANSSMLGKLHLKENFNATKTKYDWYALRVIESLGRSLFWHISTPLLPNYPTIFVSVAAATPKHNITVAIDISESTPACRSR